jgi:CelD/BcsL family acetyltransferase involved in cellulose biosynthesis
MNNNHIQVEVVRDETGFLALKKEWDALWQKAHGRFYQRHDLCLLAWRITAAPRGRKLHCIVMRENGELRLVWPLMSYRRLFWVYALQLGPDSAEYTSMLVEDGPRAAMFVERAWRAAREHCRADIIQLPFMNEGSELHRIASRERRILILSQHDSWIARLRSENDWTAYCKSLGTLFGRKPGALERRLAKEGKVEVKIMEPSDRDGIAQCINTMMSWKRAWSDRVGKTGGWLSSAEYERFLVATLTEQPREITRLIVVRLDDKPVAAAIMGHGNPLSSAVIAGFDPQYGRLAPGSVACEHAMKWAFEHGYDVDLGVGSERFKAFWSRDNISQAWSIQLANTWWGLAGFRAVRWARKVQSSIKGKPSNDGGKGEVSEAAEASN